MVYYYLHLDWNTVQCFFFQFVWYSIVRLRDTSCYTSKGITVSTKRYSISDYILEAISFKKGCYCFRYSLLTSFHVVVVRTNLVTRPAEIISEFGNNVIADLLFSFAVSCEPYRSCRSFCSLDTLRMVMCYICRKHCKTTSFADSITEPTCRSHSHCRTVAAAVVRLRIIRKQPTNEPSAIPGMRIPPPPLLH